MLSVQATTSDLSDLPMLVLEDELAALASHLSAGTCRWLELVAELDRRTQAEDVGATAGWLAWRCALDPRTAREHVRVARRLRELPLIRAAFARGELSYAKVRALTRVAEERFEEELLPIAFALTAAQLERALGAYRRVSTAEAREQQDLSWCWDEDGSLVLFGRLAPEEGALFLRGPEAARDGLRSQGGEGQCGSAEPRRIKNSDALVALAESQLGAAAPTRASGERYQVVVHVEAEALAANESAGCQLEDGPALAAETVRRIACDTSLVTSLERNGEPLNIGRRRRTVPAALRRALERRDRRCRYPAANTDSPSTPTTSSTGRTGAKRSSRTCSSSAAAITASSTKAVTEPRSLPTAASASRTDGVSRSPTSPAHLPEVSRGSSITTGTSRSTPTPARTATTNRWTCTTSSMLCVRSPGHTEPRSKRPPRTRFRLRGGEV